MKESHYNTGDIEVIDFIRDQLTPEEFNGFCKGNILKYVPRSNHKGDPIADAQKVRDYADYWISANLRTNKVAELGQVSTEKAQELADTIVELRRECRSYVETLNVRDEEIECMKKNIADRSKELVKQNETVQKLETKNKQLNSLAEMRLTKFEGLVLVKRELEAEIARLKDDKDQLEKLNKVRGEQREKYQHENVKLKDEINELKDELRKSEEENVKASRERLNSVKMAEALRESVDRLQKENAELEEKEDVIESLESQVGALLTEVKQREAENEKLKKDLGLSLPRKQEPLMSDAEFNKDYAKFVEVQAQHEPPIDEHVREEHRMDPAKIDYDKFKNA